MDSGRRRSTRCAHDAVTPEFERRWASVSVHGGRRRRRVRDSGRSRSRGGDRAGSFPVQRARRNDPEDAGAPVLHPQGNRAAVRRAGRLARRSTLAERVSGDTSVGHAVAFCQAVESLAGVEIPDSAKAWRAVLLELERLYNHITDAGAIIADTGFASRTGALHAASRARPPAEQAVDGPSPDARRDCAGRRVGSDRPTERGRRDRKRARATSKKSSRSARTTRSWPIAWKKRAG